MSSLIDYLNAFTKKTPVKDLQGYSQWVLNRFLSSEKEFVPVIAEINSGYTLTDKMHFDLIVNAFPKSNKFIKYNMKKDEKERNLQYVMDHFKVDSQIAKTYIQLMDEEEMNEIISFYEDRGTKGKKVTKKGKK